MDVSGEVYREVRERRACGGKGDHAVRAFLAVGFGENVARPDVEDESCEYAQIYEERVGRKREKQCRKRSGHGRQSVCQQEGFGALLGILMGKHERDGVHAVGEPVSDDRERDRHSHCRVYLKSETDADAVEKTVANERGSGKRADVRMVVVRVVAFVVVVYEDGFFQKVENEEARGKRDHRVGRVEIRFVGDFEDFRKDLESGDS